MTSVAILQLHELARSTRWKLRALPHGRAGGAEYRSVRRSFALGQRSPFRAPAPGVVGRNAPPHHCVGGAAGACCPGSCSPCWAFCSCSTSLAASRPVGSCAKAPRVVPSGRETPTGVGGSDTPPASKHGAPSQGPRQQRSHRCPCHRGDVDLRGESCCPHDILHHSRPGTTTHASSSRSRSIFWWEVVGRWWAHPPSGCCRSPLASHPVR